MVAKFRFISLPQDLFARARFKPPADNHSFLTIKPKQDSSTAGSSKTSVPKSKLPRF